MKQAMASLLAKDDAALFGRHDAEHAALQNMMKLTDDPTDGHGLNNMQLFVREVDGGHNLPISDKLFQMSYGKNDRRRSSARSRRDTLMGRSRDRPDERLCGDVELNTTHGWQWSAELTTPCRTRGSYLVTPQVCREIKIGARSSRRVLHEQAASCFNQRLRSGRSASIRICQSQAPTASSADGLKVHRTGGSDGDRGHGGRLSAG